MSASTRKEAGTATRPDGKATFDPVYDRPTPAAYFSALRPLGYMTPARAQPMIRRAVAALRRLRLTETVTVLDLCAGYGVNSALLKCRLSMQDLYERLASPQARAAGQERIAADAQWFRQRRREEAGVRVIAQDVARHALDYSRTVGLADATVAINLEECVPAAAEAALLGSADLIVVTGGLSYIGERTFRRVLEVSRRRPWAIYFPLRHTDTEAVDEAFEDAGHVVETAKRPIAHRLFASAEERHRVRANVLARTAAGEAPPSQTHLEALAKLARPQDELFLPPFDEIIAAGAQGHSASETTRADGRSR